MFANGSTAIEGRVITSALTASETMSSRREISTLTELFGELWSWGLFTFSTTTSARQAFKLATISRPERLRVSQPKFRKTIGALERSGDLNRALA